MKRRTLLQWLATATGTLPFPLLRAWAQTAAFPGDQTRTLRALAAVVLPSELGSEGTDSVVKNFERWVRNYRPGAHMDHGYGLTRLRSKPPSPAATYMAQLEVLRDRLSGADAAAQRNVIEETLDRGGIKELPEMPDGKNIVSDLMSFYFRGSEANDLCYRAAIQREGCHGLHGSENPPAPLKVSRARE